MANHRCIIGVRKFKQRVVMIGNFGSKYFLDQVQLIGGQPIKITGIQNSPMAYTVKVVAITLH